MQMPEAKQIGKTARPDSTMLDRLESGPHQLLEIEKKWQWTQFELMFLCLPILWLDSRRCKFSNWNSLTHSVYARSSVWMYGNRYEWISVPFFVVWVKIYFFYFSLHRLQFHYFYIISFSGPWIGTMNIYLCFMYMYSLSLSWSAAIMNTLPHAKKITKCTQSIMYCLL